MGSGMVDGSIAACSQPHDPLDHAEALRVAMLVVRFFLMECGCARPFGCIGKETTFEPPAFRHAHALLCRWMCHALQTTAAMLAIAGHAGTARHFEQAP